MKTKSIICLALAALTILTGCAKASDKEEGRQAATTAQTTIPTTYTTGSANPRLPDSHKLQFDTDKDGIYNYCPSVMQLSDGSLCIYYCTNINSSEIVDHIGFRRGVRDSEGNISWGEESIVLSPSDSGWDSHHVCDPSVVAGNFEYLGESYRYLLAYLGCTSYDNQENKIGIAVSNSPEGPFVKVGSEPLIDFSADPSFSGFQWGAGQPSLINLNKNGKIMLFYTLGDRYGTRVMLADYDLSNLSSPRLINERKLSERGLKNLNGATDFLNNADFVYDAKKDRFYATSDCHPNPADIPDYISSHFRITYFERGLDYTSFTWRNLETVSADQSSFARNHNTAILRDEYGHLPQLPYISIFYSVSNVGSDSLWSYRIYSCHININ